MIKDGSLIINLPGNGRLVIGLGSVVIRAFGRCYGLFYHRPWTYRSPYGFWWSLDLGSIHLREFRVR